VSSLAEVLRKYAERGDGGLLAAVEEIALHGHLAEYLYDLTSRRHPEAGRSFVAYQHPNGFTKVRLVSLTDLGWTLRLHVWSAHASDRDIHNHRWHFASRVLSGRLIERRYTSAADNSGQWCRYVCSASADGQYVLDDPRACDVELLGEECYWSGTSYRRSADALHLAMAGPGPQPTVTLFLQGAEQRKSSVVIKAKRGRDNGSYSPRQYDGQELMGLLRQVLNLISDA
jgi:hypothetical protein